MFCDPAAAWDAAQRSTGPCTEHDDSCAGAPQVAWLKKCPKVVMDSKIDECVLVHWFDDWEDVEDDPKMLEPTRLAARASRGCAHACGAASPGAALGHSKPFPQTFYLQ
jgi:hypothetical protein